MEDGKYRDAQKFWAINHSIDAARGLQKTHGEVILRDRLAVMTYGEIADKNNLEGVTGLSERYMAPTVHHVLMGYSGSPSGESSFGKPFDRIISEEDAKRVSVEIHRRFYDSSLGCLSDEERSYAASTAGKVSYEKKVGIHGRSPEAIGRDSCLGGRNSVAARGMISWEDGESLLLHFLDKSGAYKRDEIVSFVNYLWGHNRSLRATRVHLSRFNKGHKK